MQWDHIPTFLAIARGGSFRAAADILGVTHATAARSLTLLEHDLETRLFDRSQRGLQLTQAGEDLLPGAERMEREAEVMRRSVMGRDAEPAGDVSLSMPPLLAYTVLAGAFTAFSDTYPGIKLELLVTNRLTAIERFEADVSIRAGYAVDADVTGRKLFRADDCAYASPDYLQDHPGLAAGDGAGAEWIGWGRSTKWIEQSPFPNARCRHRCREALLHLHWVAAGHGMTMLPCLVGDRDPRLVRVPGVAPVPGRSLWILYNSSLKNSVRVRALVDHLTDALLRMHRETG